MEGLRRCGRCNIKRAPESFDTDNYGVPRKTCRPCQEQNRLRRKSQKGTARTPTPAPTPAPVPVPATAPATAPAAAHATAPATVPALAVCSVVAMRVGKDGVENVDWRYCPGCKQTKDMRDFDCDGRGQPRIACQDCMDRILGATQETVEAPWQLPAVRSMEPAACPVEESRLVAGSTVVYLINVNAAGIKDPFVSSVTTWEATCKDVVKSVW
ncbi:hypothetical protein HOY80DRAFT_1020283 [Tuber brumale]|nr:hypothetical protein HOY80DRAFT_1020283 [Tuber brumale]